ncbi:unnamed protein product, partial [Iphiclides podalirius]
MICVLSCNLGKCYNYSRNYTLLKHTEGTIEAEISVRRATHHGWMSEYAYVPSTGHPSTGMLSNLSRLYIVA